MAEEKKTKAEGDSPQVAALREQEAKLVRKLKRVAGLAPAYGKSHEEITDRAQLQLDEVRAKIKKLSKAS